MFVNKVLTTAELNLVTITYEHKHEQKHNNEINLKGIGKRN